MHPLLRTRLIALAVATTAALALPTAASAARYDSRALATGMHGSDVKQLQRYLGGAGHRVHADGAFGPRTARALKATETELELHPDGVASVRDQQLIRRAVNILGTGGAGYVPPPPPTKVVSGAGGKVSAAGFAVPPASAPQVVKDVVAAGNAIAKTPYTWGGGHASWQDSGYDCSGSVSYALHGGGLLEGSLVSGAFARWGLAGPGRWISIYANDSHVYMVVAGMRFDTSARSRTGSRWTAAPRSAQGFAVTHPPAF